MPTIKKQCQELWKKALTSPITLTFVSMEEMNRARFALYSAIRAKYLKAGEQEEYRNLRDTCEITMSKKDLVLTIQRKSANPYHENFAHQLSLALGDTSLTGKREEDLGKEAEESLRKLEGRTEEVKVEERKDTPYFKRD